MTHESLLERIRYYHRFLPGIAAKLVPLHAAACGCGTEISRPDECQNAFELAKVAPATATLLHHPRVDVRTSITVDASQTAIGAQLEQKQGRQWVPIAFFSRKLRPAEKKYSSFDRELLAAYSAVRHFRYFVEGTPFTIFTDHKPLIYTFASDADLPQGISFIAEFTTDIQHIQGKFNVVADALSRIYFIL